MLWCDRELVRLASQRSRSFSFLLSTSSVVGRRGGNESTAFFTTTRYQYYVSSMQSWSKREVAREGRKALMMLTLLKKAVIVAMRYPGIDRLHRVQGIEIKVGELESPGQRINSQRTARSSDKNQQSLVTVRLQRGRRHNSRQSDPVQICLIPMISRCVLFLGLSTLAMILPSQLGGSYILIIFVILWVITLTIFLLRSNLTVNQLNWGGCQTFLGYNRQS